MTGDACTRCGGTATVVISRIEQGEPVSDLYCDACWRVARQHAGPIMCEGPITWGNDWPEVEEWLSRKLAEANRRSDHEAWHRLLAHEVRRQLSHLPATIPESIMRFLNEHHRDASDD